MRGVLKRARRKAGMTWGRLTYTLRPSPDYLIIGAQKCGTTSLYYHLARHPEVKPARFMEIHFFDRHYRRGPRWYRSHFPRCGPGDTSRDSRGFICGEATPDYLTDPGVPERVMRTVPAAKLIVLLRNPTARAYSHYRHDVRRGRARETFEKEVAAELKSPVTQAPDEVPESRSYLRAGMYAIHLARWLAVFPRKQLLVIRSEDYFRETDLVEQTVLPFLGLSNHQMGPPPLCNAGPHAAMPGALRDLLAGYYEPYNLRLQELCGSHLQWHD
ncbi:MAG: sulfotransferase domain-containing protein [Planctomycetota bacterium]|jgi:hypothetical protein